MSGSENQSDWARLFLVGCDLIHQVNSSTQIIDHWTLGGGTAMMLQIGHRESHDIDLFLRDAQHLPFLDPKTHDFKFEIRPSAYFGSGTNFLKLVFEGIGEIDFIVAQPKTSHATIEREVEGEQILLETIPEIIAKKVVYRGSSIKPRDIFDIAAAGEEYANQVIAELGPYKAEVAATLAALEKLNPEL